MTTKQPNSKQPAPANASPRAPRKPRQAKPSPPPRPLIDLSPARQEEIAALALIGIAILTAIGAFRIGGGSGTLLESWGNVLRAIFGWGVWITPLFLGGLGVWLFLDSLDLRPEIGFERPIGLAVLFVLLLAFLHLFFVGNTDFDNAIQNGLGGGLIGAAVDGLLVGLIGLYGTIVALVFTFAIALILMFNIPLTELFTRTTGALGNLINARKALPKLELNPRTPSNKMIRPESRAQDKTASAAPDSIPSISTASEASREGTRPVASEQSRPPMTARIIGSGGAGAATTPIQHEWVLPKIGDILESSAEQEISPNEIRTKVHQIEETLAHFGVPAKVIEVNQGPTITQFGVEPGFIDQKGTDGKMRKTKVKVSRIASLRHDLELALAAAPIRIEAPVPGKSIVGIEVPNSQVSPVGLRGIMEAEAFRDRKSSLKIALGQDVSGQPIVADLGSMPHLLIAGATGSGKSVCINAIIACLICDNKPDELKLILIDPKRVELTNYNGIPHLQGPVLVDSEQAVQALKWAVREMERRLQMFARRGVRNLDGYQKAIENDPGAEKLAYLVIVVDELADLMMVAADEVERAITRLAQLARATGIHLVLATQRPSVDVVTGLIKANFPARISFAVTSQIDSRVVLDTSGAETLLGRGDMLYMAPDSSKLLRLQGCFVSDRELEKLVQYWQAFAPEQTGIPLTTADGGPLILQPTPGMAFVQESLLPDLKKKDSDEDELFAQAIQVVQQSERASVSLLQRKLRIGYSRAARLIELLEAKGYVGADEGPARGRPVLIKAKPSTPSAASSAAPTPRDFRQSGGDDFDDWDEQDWEDLNKD